MFVALFFSTMAVLTLDNHLSVKADSEHCFTLDSAKMCVEFETGVLDNTEVYVNPLDAVAIEWVYLNGNLIENRYVADKITTYQGRGETEIISGREAVYKRQFPCFLSKHFTGKKHSDLFLIYDFDVTKPATYLIFYRIVFPDSSLSEKRVMKIELISDS